MSESRALLLTNLLLASVSPLIAWFLLARYYYSEPQDALFMLPLGCIIYGVTLLVVAPQLGLAFFQCRPVRTKSLLASMLLATAVIAGASFYFVPAIALLIHIFRGSA